MVKEAIDENLKRLRGAALLATRFLIFQLSLAFLIWGVLEHTRGEIFFKRACTLMLACAVLCLVMSASSGVSRPD